MIDRFSALNDLVPLNPITNQASHETATKCLGALLDAGAADENHALAPIANLLGEIISDYEARTSKSRSLFAELKEGMEALAQMRGRTWNYRVIETVHDGDVSRAIHEVHYDNGVPISYTENPAGVAWETDDDEPRRMLDRMREALDKPVLREADFIKTN
jgi:hypothetical protein